MDRYSLKAGVAKKEITPVPGSLMAAFPVSPGRKPRKARGAYDPLFVKALVVDDGKNPVALVACDLTGIQIEDTKKIRNKICSEIKRFHPERIQLGCSHTHSGPESLYIFGNTPEDPWITELRENIVNAVCTAYKNREPVQIGTGNIDAPFNFNRRIIKNGKAELAHAKPSKGEFGPVDSGLGVLRIDKIDNSPLAVVINYTAHALVMGPGNFKYTADYPGALCRYVSQNMEEENVETLFFNGAAGNVHPNTCMQLDYNVVNEFGEKLGEKAIKAWKDIRTKSNLKFNFTSEILTFPNRVKSDLEVEVELSALSFNDTTICFCPGEIFVQFQIQLKNKSKFNNTFMFGYMNDFIGYVPIREAYKYGGYGVEICDWDRAPEKSRTRIPKGGGEKITDKLFEFIKSLHRSEQKQKI